MTATPGVHEPSREFRDRLEWQVETALRRGTRFAEPVTGGLRRTMTVALVLVSLIVGGAAGLASDRVQDARQRGTLVDTARAELDLMAMRLDLARRELDRARGRYESGMATEETMASALRQVREMETALERRKLDIEEIQATSVGPRNELNAPLVGGKDYVSARLALEIDAAALLLAQAEREVSRTRERVRVGVLPTTAQLKADAELANAQAVMQRLRLASELREQFLSGRLKADALAAEARRMELKVEVDRLERSLALARQRLQEVRRRVELGTADELDLKRMEVDLLEQELQLTRAAQELRALGARR